MKKKVFQYAATGLACVFALGIFAGCGDDNEGGGGSGEVFDNENDPLVLSTLALDRVFNPFFSTSATDGNVVGMTQISMLSNDENGNPVWGDDETVVVKDLEITTTGEGEAQKTEYKFVLKNNIQFSDGSYLSMKDVLFNLYVYLDPQYTGSSTIYSTDIVGLKEYRTQAETETEQDSFREKYELAARTRINDLISAHTEIYEDDANKGLDIDGFKAKLESDYLSDFPNIVKDYERALKLFDEELEKDWSNALNSYEDTVFTDAHGEIHRNLLQSDVEQFLYNENYITWNKNGNNGNGELSCAAGKLEDVRMWSKAQAIDFVKGINVPEKLNEVLQYWVTADDLFTELTNEEMENDRTEGDLKFPNVSGIRFANMYSSVTVNGKEYKQPTYLDEAHTHVSPESNEVLSITIKKIDPKAIWNFAFSVAPMYYYSDAEHIAKFDYEKNFGVEYKSQTFLQNVVNSPDKVGVPMGAGPYAASRASGGIDNVTAGEFYDLGGVYFERNPYFNPDGKGPAKIKKVRFSVVAENQMVDSLYSGAIDFVEPNAKPNTIAELNGKKDEGIGNKSVQTAGYGYIGINAGKVPSLNVRRAIMHCINTQETVDYYGTTAKPIYRSMSLSSWVSTLALKDVTSYYPYINGPIPSNLNVVNPDYAAYVRELGKKAGDKLTEAEQETFIRHIIEADGYSLNAEGVYFKGNDTCKYTFTVVGDETDHPAFQALWHAQELLNRWGFNVEVKTDTYGLNKLATGDLTVWAAAWGSTIDPDMYQVYHRESTASSVLNWGYRQINNNPGKYPREDVMLNELADLIERGREFDDSTDAGRYSRAQVYKLALDKVMELAIELPTYQRDDLFAYNTNKIDVSTFTPDDRLSAFKGLTSDMHLVSLNVAK